MRVQSRAFFAFTFLSTLRHWFQFIFDDLLGFTYLCFHIYIYTICKRFTTSPFMIIDMFTMNQMFSPTSDLNHPNPSSLVDPALEWSRSLFGSQGSGAWNWHHVSSKSLPQLQQMMMFHKQIDCVKIGWAELVAIWKLRSMVHGKSCQRGMQLENLIGRRRGGLKTGSCRPMDPFDKMAIWKEGTASLTINLVCSCS